MKVAPSTVSFLLLFSEVSYSLTLNPFYNFFAYFKIETTEIRIRWSVSKNSFSNFIRRFEKPPFYNLIEKPISHKAFYTSLRMMLADWLKVSFIYIVIYYD